MSKNPLEQRRDETMISDAIQWSIIAIVLLLPVSIIPPALPIKHKLILASYIGTVAGLLIFLISK